MLICYAFYLIYKIQKYIGHYLPTQQIKPIRCALMEEQAVFSDKMHKL